MCPLGVVQGFGIQCIHSRSERGNDGGRKVKAGRHESRGKEEEKKDVLAHIAAKGRARCRPPTNFLVCTNYCRVQRKCGNISVQAREAKRASGEFAEGALPGLNCSSSVLHRHVTTYCTYVPFPGKVGFPRGEPLHFVGGGKKEAAREVLHNMARYSLLSHMVRWLLFFLCSKLISDTSHMITLTRTFCLAVCRHAPRTATSIPICRDTCILYCKFFLVRIPQWGCIAGFRAHTGWILWAVKVGGDC